MIAALLEEFDLERLSDTPAGGALGRRAATCRDRAGMAARPHFMLLDEPLAGFDSDRRR